MSTGQQRGDGSPVRDMIASLDGAQFPGGCDACDAIQVIRARAGGHGNVHVIEIRHDDWCPVLAKHQGGPA